MAPKHDSKNDSGGRWSIEEVKNLFMRPFSGRNSQNSDGRNSTLSFTGLRFSLEDVKNKLFRSSNDPAEKKGKKRKGKKQLSPEERKQRRQERMEARKVKKSAQEKARRSNVNGLFDHLGNMLGVNKEQEKGARLSILSAAVTKLKEKKGMDNDDDHMEAFDEEEENQMMSDEER
mmetsp:Transcript_16491/g.36449  ORF Transcript_16491/g.36449 Transcript_16491/m.36449 type:complete len:175 (+) Transcript_16491:194-718(+)